MFPELHIDTEGRVEKLKGRRKGVMEMINFHSSKIKSGKEMEREFLNGYHTERYS